MINMLLQEGADPHVKNKSGVSPLDKASKRVIEESGLYVAVKNFERKQEQDIKIRERRARSVR